MCLVCWWVSGCGVGSGVGAVVVRAGVRACVQHSLACLFAEKTHHPKHACTHSSILNVAGTSRCTTFQRALSRCRPGRRPWTKSCAASTSTSGGKPLTGPWTGRNITTIDVCVRVRPALQCGMSQGVCVCVDAMHTQLVVVELCFFGVTLFF